MTRVRRDVESIREGFTEALVNLVEGEMSTQTEFFRMIDSKRSDSDFNPFEDYYLVYLFMKTHNLDHIVEKLHRSNRACALRLRMFFDFPDLDPMGPPMNPDQTKRILKAFRSRAEKYVSFFDDYQLLKEALDLINEDVGEDVVV